MIGDALRRFAALVIVAMLASLRPVSAQAPEAPPKPEHAHHKARKKPANPLQKKTARSLRRAPQVQVQATTAGSSISLTAPTSAAFF